MAADAHLRSKWGWTKPNAQRWENGYEVTEGSYYLLNDSISFIYGLFGKKATQSKMS